MTVEELKKLKPIIESKDYALYETDPSKNNGFNGFRLNKNTNQINRCKISYTPNVHVCEVEYGDRVQHILEKFRDGHNL